MELQSAGRHGAGHGSFYRAGYRFGFWLTDCDKDNVPGGEDGSDTQGYGFLWDIIGRSEEAGVVGSGGVRELYWAGARGERGAGFVERDMAVSPNSQELKVDAVSADGCVVGVSLLGWIVGAAIGAVDR